MVVKELLVYLNLDIQMHISAYKSPCAHMHNLNSLYNFDHRNLVYMLVYLASPIVVALDVVKKMQPFTALIFFQRNYRCIIIDPCFVFHCR